MVVVMVVVYHLDDVCSQHLVALNTDWKWRNITATLNVLPFRPGRENISKAQRQSTKTTSQLYKRTWIRYVIYFKIATILYFFIESYYLFSFIFSNKQSNCNLVIILSLRNFLSHIIYNNHLRRIYYISIIFVK